MKYKYIIVEDDPLSIRILTNIVKKYCCELELVTSASTIDYAIEIISKIKPDIVFFDVNIGDREIFEIFPMVGYYDFQSIYMSSNPDYKAHCFASGAVDFIDKPANKDRIIEAVHKAIGLSRSNPLIFS